ncbi:MAG: AGE family epimerase/isomerase, partial [Rhodothermales bacterium]
HTHDGTHGGFHEFFRSDWTAADPGEPSYMGYPPSTKQLNTHLHLMEAFTRYACLDNSEPIRERLTELIKIQRSTVVSESGDYCTDVYSTDWRRNVEGRSNQVQYGHDLENVWLLIEAHRALAVSNAPFIKLYETLFLNAVRCGWDVTHGGLFFAGRPLKRAHRRSKSWWVQAEALLCALHMYALTGRGMYFQIFEQELGWIDRQQIDWIGGEWYARIDKSGALFGGKASDSNNQWKTPYHNGRAVIHCLELLSKLTASSPSRVP